MLSSSSRREVVDEHEVENIEPIEELIKRKFLSLKNE